ncbi:DUF3108 domain-containing protein [Usitatibacter palustris]|uniref:DUF3108 domain-containing protein n=1 Tax=Usitatibacter palustris TaxID=2732487 RepID=A0A6M4H358_9PROT|nr:DUF3108 domain-containing protein [Usitatibacter palustris]QJR14021.1 hypothetical protein DSM104440_00813 [Usitatibacter palustris]
MISTHQLRAFLHRYRIALAALAVSAIAHAALIASMPRQVEPPAVDEPAYTATLDPAAPAIEGTAAATTPAPAQAKPRRARPKPSPPKPEETVASLPGLIDEPEPAPKQTLPIESGTELLAGDDVPAPPEKIALAQPPKPAALEPPKFPGEALPAKLRIAYALHSAFAEGRSEYTWSREGNRYEIFGSAQASGFFAVFLEGQITQESRGTVTSAGLRPERFTERRPRAPDEGLEFDWSKRTMTFHRNDETREGPLADNTVDWLSMIFQLAHSPPKGDRVELRVFTQRRLYTFSLAVLGEEELDLPIGKVKTLHLRHEGKTPVETVDVWLGIDQHNLPVKLRYPVARNRFQVEQVATSISR